MHVYEVRPRKDRRGVDLISDALPLSLRNELPSLVPMFEQFSRCMYRGRPLSDLRFFVGGQVCVDKAHRGRRLLARL